MHISYVTRFLPANGLDLVAALDTEILPYVIFLIVPVMGRMSDSDNDVRLLATETFASLVKLVPLEVMLHCGCFSYD
jgi:hypothetical protein